MRFRGFRTLRIVDLKGVIDFVNGELYTLMKDLFVGMTKLNFADNFQSFEAAVKLQVDVEVKIVNKLGSAIPSKFIVVRNDDHAVIIEGSTWNSEKVSLINRGPNDTTATIVFMR